MKVSVVSVPEKGKANKELVSWLSKRLKLAKSEICFVSGEFDKYKKIQLVGDRDYLFNLLKKMEEETQK